MVESIAKDCMLIQYSVPLTAPPFECAAQARSPPLHVGVDGYLVFDEKLAQLFDLETDQEMMRIEPVRRVKITQRVCRCARRHLPGPRED